MKHKLLLSAISLMMALSAPLRAEYVTIGTDTNTSESLPFAMIDNYSTTQSIYTTEEIGGAKTINAIAYQVANAEALQTTELRIYIGYTSKNEFCSEEDAEMVKNLTLVYSGSPSLATTAGWEEYTFKTPFVYNGIENLVIVVSKNADTFGFGNYYCSQTSNVQCLYRSNNNDSSFGSVYDYRNFSTITSRANIRLKYTEMMSATRDGIYYIINSDSEASIIRISQEIEHVEIPSTVSVNGNDYNVTSIGERAVYGCSALSSISIPSCVKNIGNDAFTGCTGIKEVKIEDGTTTLSLGYKSNASSSSHYYGLFKDCPIEKLYLGRNLSYRTRSNNNSSYLGHGAPFEYQSKMTSVEIGKNVTCVSDYFFAWCSSLIDIELPASLTSIGDGAFCVCAGLTSIELPASLTSIGDFAFSGCAGLTSIKLPAGIVDLGDAVFSDCSELNEIKVDSNTLNPQHYLKYGNSNANSPTFMPIREQVTF